MVYFYSHIKGEGVKRAISVVVVEVAADRGSPPSLCTIMYHYCMSLTPL